MSELPPDDNESDSPSYVLFPNLRRFPGGFIASDMIVRYANRRAASRYRLLRSQTTPPVPLFWWNRLPNFGDALSPVVVARLTGAVPTLVSRRYKGKLLAQGSVMRALAQGDYVWGTGAIQDAPIFPPKDVTFCAVRGPLTRSLIRGDVPEVYGDPAMLLPRIYSPSRGRDDRTKELAIVPHFVDKKALASLRLPIPVIDVQSNWKRIIDQIASCQAILTSSLHGLIVADAYRIPSLWITITGNVYGGTFKFRDYFLATGREPPEPVPLEKALRKLDSLVLEPSSFNSDALARAFPPELIPRREGTIR